MPQGGSQQAVGYGMLLVGGVAAVAAIRGDSFKDVLSGKSSPIKALTSAIPSSFAGGSAGGRPATTSAAFTKGAATTHSTAGTLSAKGYVSPVGAGWSQERTDMGVDFAPSHTGAPIVSPGNARVLKTGAPGWPSGEKGVLLQLLDGPLKGQVIYIYEAISPTVHAGQIVHAGQQVGSGVFGETGIEIGFADPSGATKAESEYTEGKVTVWGTKAQHWLEALPGFP